MYRLTFEKFISRLVDVINSCNTTIINNMTDAGMSYELVCVKPGVTYQKYFEILKPGWDKVVMELQGQRDECDTLASLIFLAKIGSMVNNPGGSAKKILDLSAIDLDNLSQEKLKAVLLDTLHGKGAGSEIQNIILEALAETIIKKGDDYTLNIKFEETAKNFAKLMGSKSYCWMWDILSLVLTKKYEKFVGKKSKDEIVQLMRADIAKIIGALGSEMTFDYAALMDSQVNKLTGMHAISIESELDKMIPDKLASLKKFFIKTISIYYNNLHPVVWAQIVRAIFVNFFVELPTTKDELFAFLSKQLLLNSGPFILKIIQQVRPVMPMELQKKYNLTKLTYPVMLPEQYNLILGKIVKGWDMYKIDYDKSASVGHVFIVHRVNDNYKFVIKLAKPMAIVQSCWEYDLLNSVFPVGSCEQQFVNSMLNATGVELYSPNEVKNIREAHKIYTMKYGELFEGTDIDASLTTVEVVEDVIVKDCWFGFAMTMAPGVPISSLIEGDVSKLKGDTAFRATLHRCMDLFVYKFFINIAQYGFYHGDPHAGNIYFSYKDRLLTLIDFGAVGRIDIYKDDPVMQKLISIIIMSSFSNYGDLLDTMTELVNSKCAENSKIDVNSNEYKEFRGKLEEIRRENLLNAESSRELNRKYKEFLFSGERIGEENKLRKPLGEKVMAYLPSEPGNPYLYLDINKYVGELAKEDAVRDNTEALPYDFVESENKMVGFGEVLAKITEFYALSGVNIAIKFSEFYELLKAYVLLLGVLNQINYPSNRMGIVMGKMVYDKNNLYKLTNVKAAYYMYNAYKEQAKLYEEGKAALGIVSSGKEMLPVPLQEVVKKYRFVEGKN
ncbi:MAG: hypothetical protein Hyperionvirus12_5 [Hyperionvirus sp.]|uniref:ABC1 atypical kinase-like domain-containing protein n=1 Tax=Hyperionvirus sp. TaxID=2487770 RepID=A0A3G5A974_9VIRU|nr:MAG: hypothetical protein Hyperionvirus12_5 [Hyperionvirus sp.]